MSVFACVYVFSGSVQGVGFRYRTATIAKHHPVQGYVKNLHDGTVELFVEGDEKNCQTFLEQVKREMCQEITSYDARITAPIGYDSFSIVR